MYKSMKNTCLSKNKIKSSSILLKMLNKVPKESGLILLNLTLITSGLLSNSKTTTLKYTKLMKSKVNTNKNGS